MFFNNTIVYIRVLPNEGSNFDKYITFVYIVPTCILIKDNKIAGKLNSAV